MSPENIEKNIKEEIERTEELKKAYILLSENGLYRDAITKLYYYLLYHIRALLLTKGFEPKTHEGALRLFSLYFEASEFQYFFRNSRCFFLRISARINKRNLKSPQRLGRFRGVEPYRVFKGCETLDYLVKERIFEPGSAHIFSKVMKLREEADYNPSYQFTKEDFEELKKDVENLCDLIKGYLKKW